MRKILVVIVNYKTADLTVDCLRSLAGEIATYPGCRVNVVEGGSADGSYERLEQAIRAENWGDWCELVQLSQNRGFAAGNNAAIRRAMVESNPPDYFWLLNPDTIVRPGAILSLVAFLNNNPTVGIAGSRLEEPDGTAQRSAFRFPSVASEFECGVCFGPVSSILKRKLVAPPVRETHHLTDWVSGASMMVRRSVFEAIGLLDEKYFMYFEETDFCLHARRAGWKCAYVPTSKVVHLVGKSSGVTHTSRDQRRVPAYWFESRSRYFRQNHGVTYAWMASSAWIVGHLGRRIRAKLERKSTNTPPYFLTDFINNSFGLRA
ncbi:MAG TPA: glycosyltransferase family 2 protein [Fimbriiglobus sp.]|jgi:hypothetical protein